jgi:hypothetical protein
VRFNEAEDIPPLVAGRGTRRLAFLNAGDIGSEVIEHLRLQNKLIVHPYCNLNSCYCKDLFGININIFHFMTVEFHRLRKKYTIKCLPNLSQNANRLASSKAEEKNILYCIILSNI